jgi:hypothetical protein
LPKFGINRSSRKKKKIANNETDNRPVSDAALQNLKKNPGGFRLQGEIEKEGFFLFIYPSNTFPIQEMF